MVAIPATSLKWRERFYNTMQFHYQQVLRLSLLAVHAIYVTVCVPSTVVKCESTNYAYKSCLIPEAQGVSVSTVTISRQLSNAACILGDNYGYSVTALWVTNGCRAEFLVQYGETSSSSVQVPTSSTQSASIVSSSSQFQDDMATTSTGTFGLSTAIATTQLPTMDLSSTVNVSFSSSSSSSSPSTSSIANKAISTVDMFSGITVASSIESIVGSSLANSIVPTSVQDVSTSTTVQTQFPVSTRFCCCKNNSHVLAIAEMTRALRLDKKRTSKSVRKMTSAVDSRIVSVGIGMSSVVVLLVSALLVVASDMITFYRMITRQKVHTMLETGNGDT